MLATAAGCASTPVALAPEPTSPSDDFARAVVAGLSAPRKVIPARFFYDFAGSELFEQITRLPEYYLTRTETGLLERHAGEIADLAGRGGTVVEFGAGSATKTPLLLSAITPRSYVPVDISGDFLSEAAAGLARQFPDIAVTPVVGDFARPIALPRLEGPVVGFFPGSTIGNCDPAGAIDLLRLFADTLGPDARLVIGMDLRKDRARLEAAYDDAAGVTAAFNCNLVHRINRELGGTIPEDALRHRAVWNDDHGRIEMHLEAVRDVSFRAAGRQFAMRAGETIHTENSHKYRPEEARLLARASGWEPRHMWVDEEGLFSLHLWQAATDRMQP